MKKTDITAAQQVMFNLVGHSLFSMPLQIPENVDWREVINESVAQSLPLLAFRNISELSINPEISEKLQKYLKRCTVSNINCFKGHKYIHNLLTENGITYSIIKGAASSYYYPDPLLRNMGDVDFYVTGEQVQRVRELLSDDGFEFDNKEHPYHFGASKGTLRLELHFAPIGVPNEEMRPIFLEYWSDLCDRAEIKKDVFYEYVLPSDFHHGFILLTHLRTHMMPGGVGLRHVCDWATFANSFSNQEFIDAFEVKLKRVGLWRLAQVLSLMSVKYLGMPYKEWMGDDYATADALAQDVARVGNFGRRENDRNLEMMFLSDTKILSPEKTRFGRMVHSVNKSVKRRMPIVEKCPLLYPVGWVYVAARYTVKLIMGKQTFNPAKGYRQSGKRLKLYNSLNLFKPE